MNRFQWLNTHRRLILTAVTLLVLLVGFLDQYSPLIFDGPLYRNPAPTVDSAFFQHAGWYINQGVSPYVHIWDVKPPFAAFELPALIALLSGSNMYLNHALHLLLMAGMCLGSVLLTGEVLALLVGESSPAPLAGALFLLVYPPFYLEPLNGMRAKTVMVFLILLAFYLLLHQKFFWSGLTSILVPFSWQFGMVLPVLILVEAYRSRGKSSLIRSFYGMLTGSVLVLLPIVYWDAFLPMILETMVVPLLLGEGLYVLERIVSAGNYLRLALPLVFLGSYGAIVRFLETDGSLWWIPVGLGYFVFQVVVLDLDGLADLIPLVAFVGLGLGLWAVRLDVTPGMILTFIVLLLVPLNAFGSYLPGVGPLGTGLLDARKIGASLTQGVHFGPLVPKADSKDFKKEALESKNFSRMYWHMIVPRGCHYRRSRIEKRWMTTTDAGPTDRTCGDWPDF